MKTKLAYVPIIGSLLALGGCITPGGGGSELDARASALVGQKIGAATAEFGPEDPEGGSATHQNIGTAAEPLYVHNWSRYGSTQHQRFVQTGTASAGQTLVGVIPAGGGMAATPLYQDQSAPTGYYEQDGESCLLYFTTDQTNTIVRYGLQGGYCDKLFTDGQ